MCDKKVKIIPKEKIEEVMNMTDDEVEKAIKKTFSGQRHNCNGKSRGGRR